MITRAATVLALAAAIVLTGWLLFGGGGGNEYTVKASFQNASQVVRGGLVQINGERVGEIKELDLTDDGRAELTLSVSDEHAPLPEGTIAEIRQFGLSGPASRYIDLKLPKEEDREGEIEDGGSIDADDTIAGVDLDQAFTIFNEEAREGVRNVIRGSERQYYKAEGGRDYDDPAQREPDPERGVGPDAADGWLYLDPALVSSTRLFDELNRDTGKLERFITESSHLVGDIAERRDDLAGLVDNLATTTGAISRPQGALADAIHQLPPFMRRANTTYVNLRAALDDLDPLVEDAKPVAKKLQPYVRELRFLVQDLQPTVEDLATITKKRGKGNDLVDLARLTLPLRDIAIGPVERNGKEREGALPAAAEALDGTRPRVAFARPYSTDFFGWLDDFSHTGQYDALGSFSRVGSAFNAFSLKGGILAPLTPAVRGPAIRELARTGQNNRCPGASEPDHANPENPSSPWKPYPEYNCDETQRASGP